MDFSSLARPTYETALDRRNEESILKLIERWTNLVGRKLADYDALDFGLYDPESGQIKQLVEIKRRSHRFGTFGTYMISAQKVERAVVLQGITGARAMLYVQFSDGLWSVPFEEFTLNPDLRFGGRIDRGDQQDMETVMHLAEHEGFWTKVSDAVVAVAPAPAGNWDFFGGGRA